MTDGEVAFGCLIVHVNRRHEGDMNKPRLACVPQLMTKILAI